MKWKYNGLNFLVSSKRPGTLTTTSVKVSPGMNIFVAGLRQDGSKLDWGKVTRQVLSSEPPCAQDIAAQVAFCKVWGGGKKQTFAMDALAYIQRKCSDTIVAGPIFDKLATLSLPPQNMCPYLVTAVLKCAATRGGNDKGFANDLKASEMGKITGAKQAECQEANQMMKRAVEVVNAFEDVDRKLRLTTARGDMECDMVDLIFGKTEPNDTSLNSIVDKFLDTVMETEEEPKTTAASSKTPDDNSTPAVVDALNNVAEQSLANQGVRKGTLLSKKGDAELWFEVAYINDDGSVGLYPIDVRGNRKEEISIASLETISKYVRIDAENKLTIASNDRFPSLGDTPPEAYLRGACAMAMHAAFWGLRRHDYPDCAVCARSCCYSYDIQGLQAHCVGEHQLEDSRRRKGMCTHHASP